MLSKFSVKNPYAIVVAVIVVLILGWISFTRMTPDLLPSINLPYAVVMTTYAGASPEEVETVVTKPVEQVMATVSNIKNVTSISSENSSLVILEFYNSVNMDAVTIEMRESLDMLESLWDSDEIASPMIVKLNPDMMPVMVASVDMSGTDTLAVSDLVEDSILPAFEKIDGVASVTAMGTISDTLQVVLSEEKIARLNEEINDAVDGQLAVAEAAIAQAKQQLAQGKSALETEGSKQRQTISDAKTALNQGKESLTAAESQLDQGEAALKIEQTGLIASQNLLVTGRTQVQTQVDALLAKEVLTEAEQSQLELLQSTLTEIDNQMADLAAQLEAVEADLATAAAGREELNGQKAALSQKETELTAAENTLESELSKAANELTQGESALAAKSAELDAAKDSAAEGSVLDDLITVDMITGILAAENFSMPAGYVDGDEDEYVVKVGEEYASIAEVENQLLFDLGIDGVDPVYLSDVADIQTVNNEGEMYAKINGYDGLILSFQKQTMYSTTEVAASIRDTIEELESENEGLHITALMDQGQYIDIVIDAVLKNLLWGGLLAAAILLLFLRDLKPTAVIAVSIPISLLFAVTMMYFTGVTINIISLAGLALGVGMLVDNSIVVIENIYRLRQEGHSVVDSAITGAKQVGGALTASTLTTVCVFLPIVFTEGISREIFADMGLTIAYSLLASLMVALTLVPAMASGVLRHSVGKDRRLFERLKDRYASVLRWNLRHRAIILLLAIALLGGSVYFATTMGTAFLPDSESQELSITMEMTGESTLDETRAMADRFNEILLGIDGVETVGAVQSNDMMMMGASAGDSTVSFYLILKENSGYSNAEIKKEILDRSAELDCEIVISDSNMDMSALGGSGIQVMVKGPDLDVLQATAKDVAAKLQNITGIAQVDDGIGVTEPELRITVNKAKAMENGLTVAQVYAFISSVLSEGATATTVNLDSQSVPVIVIDGNYQDLTWEDISDLEMETEVNGETKSIAIGDIASRSEAETLSSINRDNQQRYVTISADADLDHNIGIVGEEVEALMASYDWPDGYSYEIAGETETINEVFHDLFLMLGLAIALIYLIMVAQFQSLLSPFIIMFTIPLAYTGGLLALLLTGFDLSVIAMLGFLVLTGIIVNNGIILVDYTNQLRRNGMEKREALVLAGRTRMRPIFMTAFTTILGLSTLSLGMGMGADLIQPMAVVAIGGLIYGTFLTLLVVPVLYDLFQRKDMKNRLAEEEK